MTAEPAFSFLRRVGVLLIKDLYAGNAVLFEFVPVTEIRSGSAVRKRLS